MNVIDIPQAASHALYEEAIARYAAMAKSRAVGVHQVGHVRYPGLSDIDLIVVTDHVGVDNRYFFSALQRLPERYHRLFLHEPFVLPAWSLRVLRHTTHYAPKLIAGRDVLSPFRPSDEEPEERWCRMLESYCAYAAFATKNRRAQQLKGRQTMAVSSALRYLLFDAATTLAQAADEQYVNEIEALRRNFFEPGSDPVERVRTAWTLFSNAFDRFESVLREHLGTSTTEQTVERARALLCGDETCEHFDRDYAFRRARDIAGYQQELASLGFPYGHLFFVAAHPPARTAQAGSVLDKVLQNVYRVRRRLTEYAAGA